MTQCQIIALTVWFEKVFNFMPRLSMVSPDVYVHHYLNMLALDDFEYF